MPRQSAAHKNRAQHWLGAGSTLLLAICVLIAILGRIATLWPRTDLCNYLLPIWLTLGGIAIVPALLWPLRGARTGTLLLAAILAGCAAYLLVPELLTGQQPRSAPPPSDLRIVQFNLFKDNVDPMGTMAWIKGQHADVVVIEEAADAAARIPGMLAADLPYRAGCFARRPCSTQILSRQPFLTVAHLGHGDPENHQGRSMLAIMLHGPGKPFVVIGLHLDHPWPTDRQADDLEYLHALLARLPASSTIVAGDFNMVPWSARMSRQDHLIGLTRLTRALPTWPARSDMLGPTLPLLPIDHVYAGSAWRVVRVARGPTLGSDHRAIVVDLRWSG